MCGRYTGYVCVVGCDDYSEGEDVCESEDGDGEGADLPCEADGFGFGAFGPEEVKEEARAEDGGDGDADGDVEGGDADKVVIVHGGLAVAAG